MPRAFESGPWRRIVLTASAAALLVLVSASFVSVQASKAERISSWRDHIITIDGSDEDWAGLTTPVKNSHVSLGFSNDGDWLYLCLQAKHEATRVQIASTGLIVWLDAEKGRKNAFGIRFPSTRSFPLHGEQPADRPAGWPGEIDVLGPGKNKVRTVPLDQAGGIQVRGAILPDVFVYELKVPLAPGDDRPYAIGVEPGQVIRATIETPEYRGPYPRSSFIPGGSIGITIGSGVTSVGGGMVGGIPVAVVPVIPTPVSVQTTVLLAVR
jgi:hypothetical protein